MEAALFITICVMTVIAAVTAGLWARSRSARPLIGGIGLMLLPLGLYLTGMAGLAYNGVISIIDWAQRTVWDTTMSWGAGLVGVGIVAVVVAAFLTPKPRAPRASKEASRPAAAGGSRPAVAPAAAPGGTAPAAAPRTAGKPSRKGAVDPEDAEIEALLRKRGIM